MQSAPSVTAPLFSASLTPHRALSKRGRMVVVAFVAMMAAIILHTFNYKRDFYIPAETVAATEEAHTRLLEAHV